MTTLALSRGQWSPAAANRAAFAALLVARRLRRMMTCRNGSLRVESLPDYLLADIGLRRTDLQMATILGRSRL